MLTCIMFLVGLVVRAIVFGSKEDISFIHSDERERRLTKQTQRHLQQLLVLLMCVLTESPKS